MGRIIGLIGCTCLVIAALRLANLAHDDSITLKGGEDRVGAQEKLSPREHFKRGKELYLRGRYFDALPHLEEAAMSSSGLSAIERRQTEDCLNRARSKVQGVASNADSNTSAEEQSVVRGQSNGSDDETDASMEETARDRVSQLMIQAKAAYKNGNRSEAIKLAELANRFAKGAKLKFSKNELSPGEFLAKVTPLKMESGETAKSNRQSNSNWADSDENTNSSSIKQVSTTGTSRGGIQLAGAELESAEPLEEASPAEKMTNSTSSRLPNSLKERAAMLLVQAREDIKAGRFDDARRRALEANEMGATYQVLDDKPEAVLAELDRKTKTMTFARSSSPKAANVALANSSAGADAKGQLEQTGDSNEPEAVRKQRALELLQQARVDLKAGNLDAAQANAERAQQMRVAFKLFEDVPEVILNEIEDRRATENVARQGNAPSKAKGDEDAAQAKALLAKAKKALKEGRFEDARELATKADRLKVAFGLFEDSPEVVLNEIARAENKGVDRRSPATSSANDTDKETVVQAEAIELLRRARQLMKEGKLDEARLKALQVQEWGVQLPITADSPDLVLADLNKAAGTWNSVAKSSAAASEVQTANSNETESDSPVASRKGRRGNLIGVSGTRETDVEENSEFGQGLSASELYNRGMAELKRGKREIAYKAFKAAHDSGQRLDPIRTQRLNDYLRQLSPRADIQQASNQVEAAAESTPLDAVRQEQLVKFERIREDVLNAVFKAERLKESDPEKALELIDQTLAKVESAELSTEAIAPLMKQLNRTRSSLRNEMERQEPNLAMKAENKRVKDRIKGEIENAVRIDQDLVKLVDEYNDLFHQQRYAEAVVVAKKAELLSPKDPTVVSMLWKGKFALQDKFNRDLKSDKEETRLNTINDIERGLVHDVSDEHPLRYDAKTWARINGRKDKYGASNRVRTQDEIQMEQSLQKKISLHEENVPLREVIRKIKSVADINIVIDTPALEDVGVTSDTLVSIDVETIAVKSALNLILQGLDLGYMFENEVLRITNRTRQQGNLKVENYPVTDLVTPIPNFGSTTGDIPIFGSTAATPHGFGPQAYSNPGSGGQAFAQVGPHGAGLAQGNPVRLGLGEAEGRPIQTNRSADFTALTELITSTIAPESWEQGGGEASLRPFPGTLSLVIRQTQKVHEEIHDLLEQLRRLQDLQVTVEVRFVTVADRFFERIGIDFDFNIKPSTGYPKIDSSALPIPSFGSVLLPQSGFQGSSSTGTTGQTSSTSGSSSSSGSSSTSGSSSGTSGSSSTSGTTSNGFFTPFTQYSMVNNPQSTTVVGLKGPQQFTNDLTIPFTQGSFNVGIPQFGGYNPAAGVQTGIAILSDLEAFFFIQAAQGDQRTNLLFAPKVTLFNGQSASVRDVKVRPFVTQLVPTVGIAAVGYSATITPVSEGVQLSVTAVVSADRRFVRLTLQPNFTSITDVFTFQATGAGSGGQSGQGQGQGGFGGGQFGGGGGGGGAGGGQAGGGGQLGIGGGLGSMQIMQSLFTQQVGQTGGGAGGGTSSGGGGVGGGGGGAGGVAGGGTAGGNTQTTLQQPVTEQVTILTTVSVPDGGTILMGGIKRLKEGRTMSGVPILNKIPYVSRLFKNSGVGRETESLMMMVTPRIIIQEEEEGLLGQARN